MARSLHVLRAVAIVLAAIGLGLLAVAPSSAHSRLVSTNPADGSTLSASPAEISFTFDEPLLDGMNTISVNDEQGQMVTSAPVTPVGTVLTLPVDTPLADGTYQAAYRVVSADGHAVMGAISFTVAAGSGSPAPVASSASAVTASASPTPVAPVAADTPQDDGAPWVLWVVGGVIVVAIATGAFVALRNGAGPRPE